MWNKIPEKSSEKSDMKDRQTERRTERVGRSDAEGGTKRNDGEKCSTDWK